MFIRVMSIHDLTGSKYVSCLKESNISLQVPLHISLVLWLTLMLRRNALNHINIFLSTSLSGKILHHEPAAITT